MIEIKDFTQSYGNFLAVKNLNLTIENGEIFGLIGHNGAGKTTTIKSIVSILPIKHGEILVNGQRVASDNIEVKKQIAYVADSPDLFVNLPVYTYWQLVARAYGFTDEELDEKLERLTKIFSLEGRKNSFIKSLSHGMRQKVFVIGALIANPSVWILDEPMTGLDPEASHNLKSMMKEHASKGNSVLFSTHVLSVAEKLCDRIGILKKGQLIYLGTVEDLKKSYEGMDLESIYLALVGEEEKAEATKIEKNAVNE